jgi:hypothetical protein
MLLHDHHCRQGRSGLPKLLAVADSHHTAELPATLADHAFAKKTVTPA